MKNKELDLLIVVNMFLTGFDATAMGGQKPEDAWVDPGVFPYQSYPEFH